MPRDREIVVNEVLTSGKLAELLGVSRKNLIETAFLKLGWMLTVPQQLRWPQVEAVAEAFGFVARQGPEYPSEEEPQ